MTVVWLILVSRFEDDLVVDIDDHKQCKRLPVRIRFMIMGAIGGGDGIGDGVCCRILRSNRLLAN